MVMCLSACEAKYVATIFYICVQLKRILETMHMCQDKSIEIFVDNKSTIILGKKKFTFY